MPYCNGRYQCPLQSHTPLAVPKLRTQTKLYPLGAAKESTIVLVWGLEIVRVSSLAKAGMCRDEKLGVALWDTIPKEPKIA